MHMPYEVSPRVRPPTLHGRNAHFEIPNSFRGVETNILAHMQAVTPSNTVFHVLQSPPRVSLKRDVSLFEGIDMLFPKIRKIDCSNRLSSEDIQIGELLISSTLLDKGTQTTEDKYHSQTQENLEALQFPDTLKDIVDNTMNYNPLYNHPTSAGSIHYNQPFANYSPNVFNVHEMNDAALASRSAAAFVDEMLGDPREAKQGY